MQISHTVCDTEKVFTVFAILNIFADHEINIKTILYLQLILE